VNHDENGCLKTPQEGIRELDHFHCHDDCFTLFCKILGQNVRYCHKRKVNRTPKQTERSISSPDLTGA
jgi:hypothetical protein